MSKPIIGRYGGGKTTFSIKNSFTAGADRFIACSWLGGDGATMMIDGAANSLRVVAERMHPGTNVFAKLQEQKLVEILDQSKVRDWLRAGYYRTFYEGLWYDPAVFIPKDADSFAAVWDEGERVSDEPDYIVCFFKACGRDRAVGMTHGQRIADGPTEFTFRGVPYLRVGESAVRAPTGFGFVTSGSSLGERVVGRILRDQHRLTEAAGAYLASGYYGSLEEFVLHEMNPNDFKPMDGVIAAGDMLQEVRRVANGDMSAGMPVRVADRINTKYGVAGRSCLSNLFGLPRCMIDSITTIVLSAGGQALGNGLPAGFMDSLADTTESEAIWLYTPSSATRDPLMNALVGGYVDGFVWSDKSTWQRFDANASYAVSTRNRKAKSRFDRFLLANDKIIVGNSCWCERKTGKIHNFGDTYEHRYDEKLKVYDASSDGRTDFSTVILPNTESVNAKFDKNAASESRQESLAKLLGLE